MAVRHGYGKVATDGLVFAYDTGDTKNSYLGEPVENLWDDILNTQSLRTHTKHYWNGRKWVENATYTHPGINGPQGTYLGVVFKHTSGALNSSWSGNSYGYMLRDIACTNGATMTMSCWVYASTDCDVTAIPAVIEQESSGESTVTGYPATYDLNNTGTWQILAKKAISDGQVRFIPLYPRKNGVTDGSFTGFFMWALPQVTYGDHVVQPIQPGATRSVSGSLLDLTNTSEVDVTNVNFDSNAQFIFEGSERANIDYTGTDLDGNPEFTTEAVIKRTANLSNAGFWGIGGDVSLRGINGYINPSHPNKIGIDLWGTATFHTGQDYPLNEYVHVVWIKEDGAFNTTNIKIYVNGVLYTGSDLTTVRGSSHTPNLNTSTSGKGLVVGRVGPQTNLYHANGEMPMFKVYTRALTEGEVKQNFAHYKNRFNI